MPGESLGLEVEGSIELDIVIPNLEPHLREDIVDTREMQLYYLDQSKFPTRPCLLTPHSVLMIPVDLAEIEAALAHAT